jgi:uncharacterized membrane protein
MDWSLYAMAFFYFSAGVFHFVSTRFFEKMMPSFIPYHKEIVYISGVIEIILALMLLVDELRSLASKFIIVLLIAVFPANIQMSIDYWKKKNPFVWLTIVRLPLQFVLIWWAWLYV